MRFADPMRVDDVAVAHPRMPIVLAHAGQHGMASAGEVVGENPNVWADISGWFVGGTELPDHHCFLHGRSQHLVYWAAGCDRLMHGSDWPLLAMRPTWSP